MGSTNTEGRGWRKNSGNGWAREREAAEPSSRLKCWAAKSNPICYDVLVCKGNTMLYFWKSERQNFQNLNCNKIFAFLCILYKIRASWKKSFLSLNSNGGNFQLSFLANVHSHVEKSSLLITSRLLMFCGVFRALYFY